MCQQHGYTIGSPKFIPSKMEMVAWRELWLLLSSYALVGFHW